MPAQPNPFYPGLFNATDPVGWLGAARPAQTASQPAQLTAYVTNEQHIHNHTGEHDMSLTIQRLATLPLKTPLSVIVSPDEDAWLAKAPDVPQALGFGDDSFEAVEDLKEQIEEFIRELHEDDNFSRALLSQRSFLDSLVVS
ncbi:MAG: type II toxin-antitoxin system HicB family antitoxin [Lentisphaeria bacterium]|nr:type II toxin-antitoxin system HicB family antitoxin [Lentisphaeria bacterium]